MSERPWLRAIPREDVEAFRGGYDTIERPLQVGDRPALVIVDMTLAFVDDAYPTGWSATGWPCVRANASLLRSARAGGVPVYFTKSFAEADHRRVRGQHGRWRSSQRAETATAPSGDTIVEELTPSSEEIVIHKQAAPSAFFGTPLEANLIYDGVDTVVVTGMTTSGCVRATVLDAFQLNFHVVVVDTACADRSQISHSVTLFDLHMKYADVINEQEGVELLGGDWASRDGAVRSAAQETSTAALEGASDARGRE
jgi:nicotinamidase-related amidase